MNQDFEKEIQPKERVVREGQVKGLKSSRRPDAQIVDKEGKTRKVGEVERKPNGTYNKKRTEEYNNLGVEYEERNLN